MTKYKYACTSCSYTFKKDKQVADKKCPYCGRNTLYEDKQAAAQDLLNTVE